MRFSLIFLDAALKMRSLSALDADMHWTLQATFNMIGDFVSFFFTILRDKLIVFDFFFHRTDIHKYIKFIVVVSFFFSSSPLSESMGNKLTC